MIRKPATLGQVQRNGAVAAVIREAMKRKGLTQADIVRAIGVNNSTVSSWVNAKHKVLPTIRSKLAALLEVPEASLDHRQAHGDGPVVLAAAPRVKREADVLSFSISDTGEARLRFDMTLPLDKATPLLRMLLDAGLVFGA